eukprot:3337976-Rhodomonas_salina.1
MDRQKRQGQGQGQEQTGRESEGERDIQAHGSQFLSEPAPKHRHSTARISQAGATPQGVTHTCEPFGSERGERGGSAGQC